MADGAFAALGPKQTEVRKGSGQWRKLGKLFPILPGRAEANVHAAEGAAEIISKSFQGRNEYLSLQNSGHFFLVATEEDEKARPGLLNNLLAPNFLRSQMALRGQLDIGFEPAMLQKLGWEAGLWTSFMSFQLTPALKLGTRLLLRVFLNGLVLRSGHHGEIMASWSKSWSEGMRIFFHFVPVSLSGCLAGKTQEVRPTVLVILGLCAFA